MTRLVEKPTPAIISDYRWVAVCAIDEAEMGADKWGLANSAHEAYAVLLEEVDELWAHVKTKQKNRDLGAMRKEAMQVAAMAIRFAAEVCSEERGRR